MKVIFFSITNHPIRSSLWKPNGLKPPMKPMRLWAWSKIWVVVQWYPKMDGEKNDGSKLEQMDDLGGKAHPYFRKHPYGKKTRRWLQVLCWCGLSFVGFQKPAWLASNVWAFFELGSIHMSTIMLPAMPVTKDPAWYLPHTMKFGLMTGWWPSPTIQVGLFHQPGTPLSIMKQVQMAWWK